MRRLMPVRPPAPDRYPAGLTEEIPIALFVAQHRHPPDQCPASPGSGPLLLSRVSAATAARYGVTIEAEALIEREHLLLLVVQAASQQAVERFLEFLPGPGCLRVLSACSAEDAVQRGGCGPPRFPAPQSPAHAPPPSVRGHSITSSKPVRRRRAR
jgi:hypothetical protein